MIIRASIHATISRFFISILFTTFFLETLIFCTYARAESITTDCRAVIERAEVYYYTEDKLSIGVYGDEKSKHCQFSINGATYKPNTPTDEFKFQLEKIKTARDQIYELRRAFTERKEDQVKEIINNTLDNLVYLIAAPNLRSDSQQTILDLRDLRQIVSEPDTDKKFKKCITDFYTKFDLNVPIPIQKKPYFQCGVIDEQKNVLYIKFSLRSYYELLLFR